MHSVGVSRVCRELEIEMVKTYPYADHVEKMSVYMGGLDGVS